MWDKKEGFVRNVVTTIEGEVVVQVSTQQSGCGPVIPDCWTQVTINLLEMK